MQQQARLLSLGFRTSEAHVINCPHPALATTTTTDADCCCALLVFVVLLLSRGNKVLPPLSNVPACPVLRDDELRTGLLVEKTNRIKRFDLRFVTNEFA